MDPQKVKGIILALVNAKDPAKEAEFNKWMDEVHCPHVAETPGTIGYIRFENVAPKADTPKFLNIYELDRPDADAAMAWMSQNLQKSYAAKGIVTPIAAYHVGAYRLIFDRVKEARPEPEGIMVGLLKLNDPTREQEYNTWYNTKHLPAIISTRHFIAGFRGKTLAANVKPTDYLMLAEIGTPDIAGADDERKQGMLKFPESWRGSQGLATPLFGAQFKRMGHRKDTTRVKK